MRKRGENSLKLFFHDKLIYARRSLGWTQAKMAETLEVSERAYFKLDHGQTKCSALTLARFLIYVCSDPVEFLSELKETFENNEL